MIRILEIALLPFAWVYTLVMALRNLAFKWGFLASYKPSISSITVGNLSVGGTGKTPMVEYLLRMKLKAKPAVISRGYGRSSKGLLEVDPQGRAEDYGDESLQIASKFPEAKLWVSEKRKLGAQAAEDHDHDLLIFDDAFQHRYVQAHFNLVLSAFDRPFYQDFVLPAGRLRESRWGARRAQAIVITKCPLDLDESQKVQMRRKLAFYSKAPLFFAGLSYGKLRNDSGESPKAESIEIISAIAKPEPFINQLQKDYEIAETWLFRDHHLFSQSDLEPIWQKDYQGEGQWVCTEKDYVKLKAFFQGAGRLNQLFYMPVEHQFLADDAQEFRRLLESYFSPAKD